MGKEFCNQHVEKLSFEEERKEAYSTENEEKSSVVERWNRPMKEGMWTISQRTIIPFISIGSINSLIIKTMQSFLV